MSPTQQNKLTNLVKRFLDIIWFLFIGIAVIWLATVLVVGLNIPSDPEQRHTDVNLFMQFKVFTDTPDLMATGALEEGELLLSGRGDVLLNNTSSRSSWYVAGAISEALLLIFLYGLSVMRQLFTSLKDGSTFVDENAERVRKIGYVFIGWHLVAPVLQYFGSRFMLGEIAFDVPGIHLYPAFEFNVGGMVAGFAIIVLAGVLREAVSIHQDQSLTI